MISFSFLVFPKNGIYNLFRDPHHPHRAMKMSYVFFLYINVKVSEEKGKWKKNIYIE